MNDLLSKSKASTTLSQVTRFLKKEKLVYDQSDKAALLSAMETVVDSLHEKKSTQLSDQSRSQREIIEYNYARTNEYFNKKLV